MKQIKIDEIKSGYVIRGDEDSVIEVTFGPGPMDKIKILFFPDDCPNTHPKTIIVSLPAKAKITPFCTCGEKMAAKAKEILDADK